MNLKKILSSSVCAFLAFLMCFSSCITAFAGGTDIKPQVLLQGATWLPSDDIYSSIYGTAASNAQNVENNILTGLSFEDGELTVNVHPYLEGTFDEDNHKDALVSVTVNLYKDSEENWVRGKRGEALTGLVATGSVSGIELNKETLEKEVAIQGIPDTFIAEAVMTLSDGATELLTESVTNISNTEAVKWQQKATLEDVLKKASIDESLAVNLDTEKGKKSQNYYVFRTDAAMVKDGAMHVLTKSSSEEDAENTFILSDIPSGFLAKYPDNDALEHVSELVFYGTVTLSEDKTTYTIKEDPEGTGNIYQTFPVVSKAYRAKVENPLTFDDYEYQYKIQYIYDNGTSNDPTGLKFVMNNDAKEWDMYSYASRKGNSGADSNYTFSKHEDISGYSVDVTLTPGYDFDHSYSILTDTKYVKITMTQEASYQIRSVGEETEEINQKLLPLGRITEKETSDELILFEAWFNLARVSGKGSAVAHASGKLKLENGIIHMYHSPEYNITYDSVEAYDENKSFICRDNTRLLMVMDVHASILSFGASVEADVIQGLCSEIEAIKDDQESDRAIHLCNDGIEPKGCTTGYIVNPHWGSWDVTIHDGIIIPSCWENHYEETELRRRRYFYSTKYDLFGFDRSCPFKISKEKVKITATPGQGVYSYREEGITDIRLWCQMAGARGRIFYRVRNQNSEGEEPPKYQQYQPGSSFSLTFDPGDTFDVKFIDCYLELNGEVYSEETFTYIMLAKDKKAMIIPTSMELAVGEDATAICLYPSTDSFTRVEWYTEGDNCVTLTELDNEGLPGVAAVQVTGQKEGKTKLLAYNTSTGYARKSYCEITVNDHLSAPSAAYGTSLYMLKEIDLKNMQLGSYKDQNLELEENAPYYYHNGKHCIGEQLSHYGWNYDTQNPHVKIYYTTDGTEPTINSTEYRKNEKIYLSLEEDESYGIVTLKAIAYDDYTGKISDTSTWYYVIVDTPPDTSEATVIMIPETKHLSCLGLGLCIAIYIPTLSDILNKDNWTNIKLKWTENTNESAGETLAEGTSDDETNAAAKIVPCFQVGWWWWSNGWLTVPVFGTNEWITEPLIAFDCVQVGLLLGLRETGKDDYVKITATGECNSYDMLFHPGGKAKGTCKVYVYNEEEPETRTSTVSYNTNGGSGSFPTQTKKRGETIKLHSASPTRTGYKFMGWSMQPDGSAVQYQPGDNFRRDDDIVLYAVWLRKDATYVVKYDANGGTKAPASQEKTAGKNLTLSTDIPVKDGYLFLGWSEFKDDASVQYKAGDVYKKDKDVVLYAKWRETTKGYTVKFDANGGTGAPADQKKVKGEPLTLSETQPTREGYEFKGWALKENPTLDDIVYRADVSPKVYNDDADATFYAVWKEETGKYVIEYDANGGTGAPASDSVDTDQDATISNTKPTRTGYKFEGWFRPMLFTSPEFYAPGDTYSARVSTTLYALWETATDVYVVTYEANGGENAPAPTEQELDKDMLLSTQTPNRDGYTFQGWSRAKDSNKVEYRPGDYYRGRKSITLYAVWKADGAVYSITYDANGGTDAPQVQYKGEDVSINLSTGIPERKSCYFLGWSEDKYAETPDYLPGDAYAKNADLYLYAVWVRDPNVYLIEYNANGGIYAPEAQVKLEDEDLQLTDDIAVWDGGFRYIFRGWSTDPKAAKAEYQPSDKYKKNEDAVLYAVWEKRENFATVTYHACGGTGAPLPETVISGSQIRLSYTVPTRAGYTFLGWSKTEGGTIDYQPGAVIPALYLDMDLYASWQLIDTIVELKYDANGGSDAPETLQAFKDNPVKISTKKPQRKGYRFLGWSENKSATLPDETYAPGKTITLSANKTLYAIWVQEWTVTVLNGTFNDEPAKETVRKYLKGETVKVIADTPEEGKRFTDWTVEAGDLKLTDVQAQASAMEFTMPASDVVILANEAYIPVLPHTLQVVGGTANGKTFDNVYAGTRLSVVAAPVGGMMFSHWEAEGINLTYLQQISPTFTTIMPDNDVKLTAVFESAPINPYQLTVINGTIGDGFDDETTGAFFAGSTITVTADDEPATAEGTVEEYVFDKWVVVKGDLELTKKQAKSETITFTMPEEDVTLEATFRSKTPGTGDFNRLFMWMALAVGCSLMLIGGIYLATKGKRKN